MPIPRRDMDRFCVLKWSDIINNLNTEQLNQFDSLLSTVTSSPSYTRREYVVISNKNEDLYEEVWGMKLANIHNQEMARREAARNSFRDFLNRQGSSLNESRRTSNTTDSEPVELTTPTHPSQMELEGVPVARPEIDDLEASYEREVYSRVFNAGQTARSAPATRNSYGQEVYARAYGASTTNLNSVQYQEVGRPWQAISPSTNPTSSVQQLWVDEIHDEGDVMEEDVLVDYSTDAPHYTTMETPMSYQEYMRHSSRNRSDQRLPSDDTAFTDLIYRS